MEVIFNRKLNRWNSIYLMLTKNITSTRCTQIFCEHDRIWDNWIAPCKEDQENWKSCFFIIFSSKNKCEEVTNDYTQKKSSSIALAGIFDVIKFSHNSIMSTSAFSALTLRSFILTKFKDGEKAKKLIGGSELTNSRCCLHKWIYEFISNWVSKLQSRRTTIKESMAMGNVFMEI